MNRHTTPMYRPPEILDTYLNYPINTAMDVWAFGCMVYLLIFGKHPFEDSSKLRIINCNYTIPASCPPDDLYSQIIRYELKVARVKDYYASMKRQLTIVCAMYHII